MVEDELDQESRKKVLSCFFKCFIHSILGCYFVSAKAIALISNITVFSPGAVDRY
jgi:hypothetical protein